MEAKSQTQEHKIADVIEQHGWFVAVFEATETLPSFAYTIGLYKNYQHAEIIVFGFNNVLAVQILNIVGDMVKSGIIFQNNVLNEAILEQHPVQFLEVHMAHYPEYFGYACSYYENTADFPVLQLVWTDEKSKFPWEAEFNPTMLSRQRLLDVEVEFKFSEPKNIAVYTSRQVANEDYPVLEVYHDEEGDWQFLCGTTDNPDDAIVYSLEAMLNKDKTLNDLFHLAVGYKAVRETFDSEWIITKIEAS